MSNPKNLRSKIIKRQYLHCDNKTYPVKIKKIFKFSSPIYEDVLNLDRIGMAMCSEPYMTFDQCYDYAIIFLQYFI